jgi:guanosine-3',5'-bis(diphosphate) 3'-pyrophosphohydrolase
MDYLEPCYYSNRLIEKVKLLDTQNKLDFTLINKAIYWAKKYHGDQKRKSGEPYYSHPLEVAYMASDYYLKTDVIVASILHDIIEDTEVDVGMILANFSWRIAEMVDRLTRDRLDGSKLSVEEVLNNAYQKQDEEVLIIKLFDRLHNMRTLGVKSPEKFQKICKETIEEFIILALYLENLDLTRELVTLCYNNISISPTSEYMYLSPLLNHSSLLSQVFQNDSIQTKILYLLES